MLNYILLALAAVCIAFQFSLRKIYQAKFTDGTKSVLFYSVISSVASIVLYFIMNGFHLSFSAPSFFLAMALSVISTLNGLMGIVVVRYGEVSVYTMFMMLGGMLLPYVHGILFLNENPSVWCIIGIFVLVGALFLSAAEKLKEKTKNVKLFTLLCIAVFCLNGCVSIFSKLSRVIEGALPVYDFLIWNSMFGLLYSIIILTAFHFITKAKDKPNTPFIKAENGKTATVGISLIVLVAGIGSIGYLFQLIGAESLPSTVLYPIVSGGSIVLTAIAGALLFKERISPLKVISLVLTTFGTVLFLF